MKKKSVLFFLLFVLTVFSLSANQVTYDYSDKEYKLVEYFSQISNMTGPHDTTPVSGSLLTASLNRVDKTSLPTKLQSLYENLFSRLTDTPSLYKSETMMLDLDTLISPEIYLKAGDHANRADWYNGYDDRKALLQLILTFLGHKKPNPFGIVISQPLSDFLHAAVLGRVRCLPVHGIFAPQQQAAETADDHHGGNGDGRVHG